MDSRTGLRIVLDRKNVFIIVRNGRRQIVLSDLDVVLLRVRVLRADDLERPSGHGSEHFLGELERNVRESVLIDRRKLIGNRGHPWPDSKSDADQILTGNRERAEPRKPEPRRRGRDHLVRIHLDIDRLTARETVEDESAILARRCSRDDSLPRLCDDVRPGHRRQGRVVDDAPHDRGARAPLCLGMQIAKEVREVTSARSPAPDSLGNRSDRRAVLAPSTTELQREVREISPPSPAAHVDGIGVLDVRPIDEVRFVGSQDREDEVEVVMSFDDIAKEDPQLPLLPWREPVLASTCRGSTQNVHLPDVDLAAAFQ